MEVLLLDGNRISSRGAAAIADLIPNMPNLTELSLSDNKIGDGGAIAIAS